MATLTIHLIRHGESTGNLIRQLQSIVDTELTENGIEQAKGLKGEFEVEVVYHSPLKRAAVTAKTIFDDDTELVAINGLGEVDIGVLAGKLYPELDEEELAMMDRHETDRDYVVPNGESKNQLQQRVVGTLQQIIQDMLLRGIDETVVITHGGVLGEFLREYLGLADIRLGNCSVHTIRYDTVTGSWEYIEESEF